jgi:hypothetical protein
MQALNDYCTETATDTQLQESDDTGPVETETDPDETVMKRDLDRALDECLGEIRAARHEIDQARDECLSLIRAAKHEEDNGIRYVWLVFMYWFALGVIYTLGYTIYLVGNSLDPPAEL